MSWIKVVFFVVVSLFLFSFEAEKTGSLVVNVKNIDTVKGQILLGVYESEQTFLKKGKQKILKFSPVKGEIVTMKIDEIPYKEYALAAFHDVNNNGKLDLMFGIPVEPYGFLRKPNTRWRLPYFQEMSFQFSNSGQEVSISLERW